MFDSTGSVALQWLPTPRVAHHAELEIDVVMSLSMMGANVTVALPDTIF